MKQDRFVYVVSYFIEQEKRIPFTSFVMTSKYSKNINVFDSLKKANEFVCALQKHCGKMAYFNIEEFKVNEMSKWQKEQLKKYHRGKNEKKQKRLW